MQCTIEHILVEIESFEVICILLIKDRKCLILDHCPCKAEFTKIYKFDTLVHVPWPSDTPRIWIWHSSACPLTFCLAHSKWNKLKNFIFQKFLKKWNFHLSSSTSTGYPNGIENQRAGPCKNPQFSNFHFYSKFEFYKACNAPLNIFW